MKKTDMFEFKSLDAPMHFWDATPYDDEVNRAFRAEDPAPPPFDTNDPFDSPAMDLIAWAFDQLG